MTDAVYPRTPPQAPASDEWVQACHDYDAGYLIRRAFGQEPDLVTAQITLTFSRAWTQTPLSALQRQSTLNACALIAANPTVPDLNPVRCPLEPVGAWMASPYPHVTLTWRSHPVDGAVLLTLSLAGA